MLFTAYNPLYNHQILPEGHKFPMIKYVLLRQQLLHQGILDSDDFFDPEGEVSEKAILRVHQKEYVQKLNALNLTKIEERRSGFPLSLQLIQREKTIMLGGLIGAKMALESGGISMNIAGGTHHAYSDRAEGFCLLNDMAIAAAELLETASIKRILIVDLDVHQGNGTAEIFKNNPSVFTFSAHAKNNYPFKKEASDVDLAFDDNCNGKSYLPKVKEALHEILAAFKPQFVFYQCGVDVLESDKLGKLALSIEDCQLRDRMVFDLVRNANIAMHCCMGGGYSKDIKVIVDAHSNTFREAQDFV